MASDIIGVLKHAVMISGFVFVMMLIIEYLNVLSRGEWYRKLASNRLGQYLVAGFLGVLPGCLGAFVAVAMFSHGYISIGAIVTAMIATSGDESFVMLAMIPQRAFLIFGALLVIGIIAGFLVDLFIKNREVINMEECCNLEVHDEFREAVSLSWPGIIRLWKNCSLARAVLAVLLAGILLAVVGGQVGPARWNWVRVTLVVACSGALFIVSTVQEHFLEEHLWEHIAKKHLPKIFLWTFGILLLVFILNNYLGFDFGGTHAWGRWILLLAAALIGFLPQSGPHLVFLTLYAQGTIPVSVLMANSIVQDGHGMIPLVAESRKAFFVIKFINLAVGLGVGAVLMAAGR